MTNPLVKQTIPLCTAATSATPHPKDPAWAAWQRHVDAVRIGSKPGMTFERRVRMMRNETALFGEVRTRELLEF
ncbi:MAG: hypothetical protein ACX930_03390 [Erythrobacter sp.]